jgi:DUF3096 family protein
MLCWKRAGARGTGGSASRLRPPLSHHGETVMTISIAHLQPAVALIAGILILLIPRLLNFIVAIYLILVGIIGLGLIK